MTTCWVLAVTCLSEDSRRWSSSNGQRMNNIRQTNTQHTTMVVALVHFIGAVLYFPSPSCFQHNRPCIHAFTLEPCLYLLFTTNKYSPLLPVYWPLSLWLCSSLWTAGDPKTWQNKSLPGDPNYLVGANCVSVLIDHFWGVTAGLLVCVEDRGGLPVGPLCCAPSMASGAQTHRPRKYGTGNNTCTVYCVPPLQQPENHHKSTLETSPDPRQTGQPSVAVSPPRSFWFHLFLCFWCFEGLQKKYIFKDLTQKKRIIWKKRNCCWNAWPVPQTE